MQIFAVIVTLFVVGSLAGWIIELFYRRFVSQKRWMNPGFLTGPYLPIYGFGVLGMYALSELFISLNLEEQFNIPIWASYIIQILAIGIILITIEFVAGLIFIKGLGLKLWDYSKCWGNALGVICPLYDVIWTAAGAIYYFFVHPYLKTGVMWLAQENHNIYYLFIGIVLGMMIVDFFYSAHVATVIVSYAKKNKIVIKLSEIQKEVKEKNEQFKKKLIYFPSPTHIKEILTKQRNNKPNEDNQED